MSGLRIPILLSSIGGLLVLVLQNRTPVIQITFLGMRSRPFSLGLWVTLALFIGVMIGLMVQMGSASGAKPTEARTTSRRSKRANAQPQGFRSNPIQDFESTPFESEPTTASASSQDNEPKSDWGSPPSTSWDGEQDRASEFWAAPEKRKARPRPKGRIDRGLAKNQHPAPDLHPNRISLERDDTMPTPVVEAEYRVVSTPYSRFEGQEDDGFDDEFFDEFFDEEK